MKKDNKSHGVQLLIRCVVRDPDGKIITDTGEKRARSFVLQFLTFIYAMGRATDQLAKATDGTNDPLYTDSMLIERAFRIMAGVGEDPWGVVVGTGDTAADNADFTLETQLTEGVGAGNITHGSVITVNAAVVGANVDFIVERAFSNLTGSEITVKEAGIYTRWGFLAENYYHCIIRDVLSPAVDVPDKCSLTVIYTVRTTV